MGFEVGIGSDNQLALGPKTKLLFETACRVSPGPLAPNVIRGPSPSLRQRVVISIKGRRM